ncbi:hypothetical protein VPHK348_0024 [Vibrio phage K348]
MDCGYLTARRDEMKRVCGDCMGFYGGFIRQVRVIDRS